MKSVGEGRLRYLAQSGADTEYYNIAKDLATVNSRNEEITDRQGNLYGYWCKVETTSAANDTLALSYIPNSWKVRNAFRKFHFARQEMFRDAGITRREMGKYGRTLRPYFSKDHLSSSPVDQPPLKIMMAVSGRIRLWSVLQLSLMMVKTWAIPIYHLLMSGS